MSQRKERKRRRESGDDSPERGSVLDVKRKRLEHVLDVLKSNKDGSQMEPEVQVRRSGRTPKAKVFDDDYVTESVRASESPRSAASKSATSCPAPHEEVVYLDDKRIKIKKEPVDFDIGHKRETRRSYQQYLEELGNQSNASEDNVDSKNKPSKETSMNPRKVKLELAEEEAFNPATEMYNKPALVQRDNPRDQKNAEKKREKERTPKEAEQQLVLGSAGLVDDPGISEQADITLSPKVRSSSRAPVPKRTFPLLQEPVHHTVSERQQSSREENKCITVTEVKEEPKELVSKVSPHKVRTSTRTPVPKRSFSLLEDEGTYHVKEEAKSGVEVEENEPQGSQLSTPPEPSPARSSSRTPVRKRPITLLEGLKERRKADKIVPCDREGVSVEIGAGSSSGKKRKKGYSSGVMVGRGESDGIQVDKVHKQQKDTVAKNHSGKGTKKKLVKEFGRVSGEVNTDAKRSTKRKPNKNDVPEVVIKQEAEDGLAMGQGMYQTAVPQGKSLLLNESAKNSPSRSENSVSLADLALEISKSLTSLKPSDNAKRTDVTSKKTMKSGQKVKHAAKKHAHNDGSPRKIRRNIGEASSEVFEEEEHIILKLHLPHSSDHASKSSSKKHKHRHASESRDGVGSPKKKHKKSTSKSSVQPAAMTKKKKKISLKFKGLSSRHIGLEVDGTTSGDSTKVAKKSAGHSGKTGDNSATSTSVEGSGKKKKKSLTGNDSSTHSQPKTGHVSKDKEGNKSRSKEKGVRKGKDQVLRTAAGESTSTKSNEGSPRKKKDNKKPKMVTSYLLFCKEERSKIVKENPGLEFSQISKKVGESWNHLPEEEKQIWRQKAYEGNQKVRDMVESYSQKLLEPIDMAAHLRLLGESLLTIGVCLGQQDEMEVHGSLSVLLDSALCAMSPLLFLTSQVPELNGCPKAVQAAVLDNLSHIMPGLG